MSSWRILSSKSFTFSAFWGTAKNVSRVTKKRPIFFLVIFVKGPIKPLGKIFRTKKTDYKFIFFFSELQELENRAKFRRLGQIRLHKIVIWLHKLIMYDSNTLTDVLGNFVCIAIWGSVKGCSAVSCQDLLFFSWSSFRCSIHYPFIISFAFLFLHFFAGTPACIGACRISHIFQVVVFCCCRLCLQSWWLGREVERQRARSWQCSSSTSFYDKYSSSGAAFLHRWNI